MCSFRLYGIIRSHPRDTEKYPCQDGGTARLNRGTALWDPTFPQREYHAHLHTTCSVPGYQRGPSSGGGMSDFGTPRNDSESKGASAYFKASAAISIWSFGISTS